MQIHLQTTNQLFLHCQQREVAAKFVHLFQQVVFSQYGCRNHTNKTLEILAQENEQESNLNMHSFAFFFQQSQWRM